MFNQLIGAQATTNSSDSNANFPARDTLPYTVTLIKNVTSSSSSSSRQQESTTRSQSPRVYSPSKKNKSILFPIFAPRNEALLSPLDRYRAFSLWIKKARGGGGGGDWTTASTRADIKRIYPA